jgi:transposase
MSGNTHKRYPPELKERAVRMVAEAAENGESEWSAMRRIAELLGVGSGETVRRWVRQAQVDAGDRAGTTTEESTEVRRLKRENAEAGFSIWARPLAVAAAAVPCYKDRSATVGAP